MRACVCACIYAWMPCGSFAQYPIGPGSCTRSSVVRQQHYPRLPALYVAMFCRWDEIYGAKPSDSSYFDGLKMYTAGADKESDLMQVLYR